MLPDYRKRRGIFGGRIRIFPHTQVCGVIGEPSKSFDIRCMDGA